MAVRDKPTCMSALNPLKARGQQQASRQAAPLGGAPCAPARLSQGLRPICTACLNVLNASRRLETTCSAALECVAERAVLSSRRCKIYLERAGNACGICRPARRPCMSRRRWRQPG